MFAAALAARTKRVRITISALLATLYDPVKLAEDLAVLDLASRGRVSTTLGMGYRPEEYASLGKDFAARGKLLDECIEVLLRAWTGEPFEWRGRSVRVTPRRLQLAASAHLRRRPEPRRRPPRRALRPAVPARQQTAR